MKGTEKYLALVAALLGRETTLSLATCGKDGTPCIAPLFYFADEELTLYWLSSPGSVHGLNLERSCRAAATVYRSAENWRRICGVQMRGEVSLVSDAKRCSELIKAYRRRFKIGRIFSPLLRQSTLYAFRPEFFRFIDNARGFGFKFELTRQPDGWQLTRSKG
ncbi:MAG: pyridoxamine 5'-phosphate oxidase family protein [Terracidiphilus sp.]|jgi:uncharacterized protein YhbP (UPF0306 family)